MWHFVRNITDRILRIGHFLELCPVKLRGNGLCQLSKRLRAIVFLGNDGYGACPISGDHPNRPRFRDAYGKYEISSLSKTGCWRGEAKNGAHAKKRKYFFHN